MFNISAVVVYGAADGGSAGPAGGQVRLSACSFVHGQAHLAGYQPAAGVSAMGVSRIARAGSSV